MSSSLHASTAVSIIVPTYNRPHGLKRCLVAVRTGVKSRHEIIVVGGDESKNMDGWLKQMPDVKYIHEERRDGMTAALNTAMHHVNGRYVMWLHDDARPLPGAIDAAMSAMKRPDFFDVGMALFYHTNLLPKTQRHDSVLHEGANYSVGAVRGQLYSNFGIIRREILDQLGHFDSRFYLRCWDVDLSLRVQNDLGRRVVGLRDALIAHEIQHDERRLLDGSVAERDLQRMRQKWELGDDIAIPPPDLEIPAEVLGARMTSKLFAIPASPSVRPSLILNRPSRVFS